MVREGEKYRSLSPIKVIAMTAWKAPSTGGEHAVLPANEIFTIAHEPVPGATAVYCDPVDYERLHSHFVSEKDRKSPIYGGYYLCIYLKDLAENCELIND